MTTPKHNGVIAVGALLAGLVIAVGYGWYAFESRVMDTARDKLMPLPQIPVVPPVPPNAMAKMDRLQPRLARLAVPTEGRRPPVDLGLFGYQPVVRQARPDEAVPAAPTRDDFPRHVVSMAFVSSRHAFAVVDGELRRRGDRLENGTRVLRIVPGRVLLEWEGIEEWFEVSNPLSQDEAVAS